MPMPNDTDNTTPRAASSCRRNTLRRVSTAPTAIRPPAAAPSSRPGNHLPVPPSATITSHAAAMPGSVAWLTASETRARLRNRVKVPTMPAAMPSRATPTTTTRVLKSLRSRTRSTCSQEGR